MNESELADLRQAVRRLESIGWAIRLANYAGKPLELGIDRLPAAARKAVDLATRKALEKGLDVAIRSMGPDGQRAGSPLLHKVAATAAGGVGGAFSWPALVVELPISTTIMLRAIADTARAEGEDLSAAETRLECLSVFALGSPSAKDDAAESGYFATRAALAKAVSVAADHIAAQGMGGRGAPVLVNLLGRIAARFNVAVSQKLAAQMLPVVGAAGGAAVNLVFIDHFQEVARGHFVVRRLERKYGHAAVRAEYQRLADELRQKGGTDG